MEIHYIELEKLQALKPIIRFKPYDLDGQALAKGRFGVPVLAMINRNTGRLLTPMLIAAIARIKELKAPAPAGVKVDKGQWLVATLAATYSDTDEAAAAIAANGGIDGGLLGYIDLADHDKVINFIMGVEKPDEVRSIGISVQQAAEILLDEDNKAEPLPPIQRIDDFDLGIHNLDPAMQIEASDIDWIKWGRVARSEPHTGGVHFYTDDYKFNGVIEQPEQLAEIGVTAAVEPNISNNTAMPGALFLPGVWQKRATARRWQREGIRIAVDMNVESKFLAANLIGVPIGWRAYACRAYRGDLDHLQQVAAQASDHAGGEILFFVFGGNVKVRNLCKARGWTWVRA